MHTNLITVDYRTELGNNDYPALPPLGGTSGNLGAGVSSSVWFFFFSFCACENRATRHDDDDNDDDDDAYKLDENELLARERPTLRLRCAWKVIWASMDGCVCGIHVLLWLCSMQHSVRESGSSVCGTRLPSSTSFSSTFVIHRPTYCEKFICHN